VSGLAGSAQDLTWTAVLPSDGAVPVPAVGPTFWWGGTVTDPNPHALFGQGFLEVQFYPDAIVNTCSSDGGFNVTFAPDKFSVCSPVWQITTTSGSENAAFDAELYNGSSKQPLVMNGGDTITIHFFVASAGQGWNVSIADLTTGQSGTIVLNSKYGPMLPAFSTAVRRPVRPGLHLLRHGAQAHALAAPLRTGWPPRHVGRLWTRSRRPAWLRSDRLAMSAVSSTTGPNPPRLSNSSVKDPRSYETSESQSARLATCQRPSFCPRWWPGKSPHPSG
jgi:hypothetical protein